MTDYIMSREQMNRGAAPRRQATQEVPRLNRARGRGRQALMRAIASLPCSIFNALANYIPCLLVFSPSLLPCFPVLLPCCAPAAFQRSLPFFANSYPTLDERATSNAQRDSKSNLAISAYCIGDWAREATGKKSKEWRRPARG